MPFSKASYDPHTLAVLTQAFEEAWRQVRIWHPGCTADQLVTTRKMMALRMMTAAKAGESDPERLRLLALRAVDGRNFD
jgi:hypothetical protein